jgi:cephalosporin hydroxylase
MEVKNLNEVMAELDKWVSRHGNGKYIDDNWAPDNSSSWGIPEDSGIQQTRSEIADFAEFLLQRDKDKLQTALEVGLGYFGSTHFLWRLIFNHTVTIEKSHERIRLFGETSRDFYGKWIADDGKSSFLIGMSNDVPIVRKTYALLKDGVDLLFIDGNHSYESVLADWLLYSPLVKKGGIIAFHDAISQSDNSSIPRFLQNLEEGKIDGKNYKLSKIIHSRDLGIAYYEKTD